MNVIYNLFPGGDASNPIPVRIETRKNILGITNEKAFNKMIFGFFENGAAIFRAENKNEACAELEFFAGSLSAKTFRSHVKEFLKSPDAEKLKPSTLKSIKEFIEASEHGADQAYLVDIARSNDLRFVWLAATGSNLLLNIGSEFKADDKEAIELITHTIEKIKALKVGESVTFLTGTAIHETLCSVQRNEGGIYDVYYSDSANSPTLMISAKLENEILDEEFWKELYGSKLQSKEIKISELLPDHLPGIRNPLTKKAKSAAISPQTYNTCHIKCQVGLIKAFIVIRSELPTHEAVLEWKQFKVQLGNFLIEKNKTNTNADLIALTNIGHEKHKKTLDRISVFNQCINEGKYEETVNAFNSLFSCNFRENFDSPTDYLNNLSLINKYSQAFLNTYYYTQDDITALAETIDNPVVKFVLNNYKKVLEKVQATNEKQLLEQIDKCSKTTLFSHIDEWIGNSVSNDSTDYFLNLKKGTPVASTQAKLEEYLALLDKNPAWLSDLKQKPSFIFTLVQGMKLGCIEQVTSIVAKMEISDREWFEECVEEAHRIHKQYAPLALINNAFKNRDISSLVKTYDYYNKPTNQLLVSFTLPTNSDLTYFKVAFETTLFENMLTRLNNDSTGEILKELQDKIATLDKDHRITKVLKNAVACHLYQSGRLQEAFSPEFNVSRTFKFTPKISYTFTLETYPQALDAITNYPSHPLGQQILIDLISYAVEHKDRSIYQAIDNGIICWCCKHPDESEIDEIMNDPDPNHGKWSDWKKNLL